MSGVHLISDVRNRLISVIEDANATVTIGGSQVPVTVLKQLSAGHVIAESKLPAVHVMLTQDDVSERTNSTEDRRFTFNVALFARDVGDPQDQLDELQLCVEKAVAMSSNLDGGAKAVWFLGAQIGQSKGEYVTGQRVMRFAADLTITAGDPSV